MMARRSLPVRGIADATTRRRDDAMSLAPAIVASSSPRVVASVAARDAEVAPLWAALGDVLDPEFPISIVDLGLVYGIRRSGGAVEVDLTFTATACPCMDFIHEDVRERLLREPGVREVRIRDVWDPPWTRERITAAGRATLRRHGVAA